MLMLYFSGTGNSKYVATTFSKKIGSKCHSIEENIDFSNIITNNDVIGFCYPIYGSCVPKIMRDFVAKYVKYLKNKKLIIFCTQLMFSGDGARAFTDLLPKDTYEIIYAEHFNMPNNICNVPIFSIKNGEKTKKHIKAANKKIDRVCKDINNNVVKKRGFNNISHMLGKSQSVYWPEIEEKNKSDVVVDNDCIKCGACVKLCPVNNLSISDNCVKQSGNCIICYRCVNACSKKAITVLIHKKPKKQYKGIK